MGRRMWPQACAHTRRLARIGRTEARFMAGIWENGQPEKNGGDHGGSAAQKRRPRRGANHQENGRWKAELKLDPA